MNSSLKLRSMLVIILSASDSLRVWAEHSITETENNITFSFFLSHFTFPFPFSTKNRLVLSLANVRINYTTSLSFDTFTTHLENWVTKTKLSHILYSVSIWTTFSPLVLKHMKYDDQSMNLHRYSALCLHMFHFALHHSHDRQCRRAEKSEWSDKSDEIFLPANWRLFFSPINTFEHRGINYLQHIKIKWKWNWVCENEDDLDGGMIILIKFHKLRIIFEFLFWSFQPGKTVLLLDATCSRLCTNCRLHVSSKRGKWRN